MRIVWEERGRLLSSTFQAISTETAPEVFRKTALSILSLLDEPKTLSQVARDLGITPQTALYYLKKLREAGAVILEGGRYYRRNADAYGVVFSSKELRGRPVPRYLDTFFYPFAREGSWRSIIVVGAPDPHGYYLQRARDGHYVGVLGAFIGSRFKVDGFPVRVDIDISYRWRDEDLVLVGGPVSNTVSFELVEESGLFFDIEKPWMLRARNTYTGENVGVIAKVQHADHWYLLLAGVTALGTKATVMALVLHTEELLARYTGGEHYWIVEGLDKDGDGTIDMIKLLEEGKPRAKHHQPRAKQI